ncbi:serine hydrolase domain-containing protein [Paenibacillus aestuarii]|uniref:Serine hydrolase domain-containing protein n=1 Tax=Paenibacillus aestuarii TaxID=516965 RepID=A0ABW0K9Y3_9BACL|nr:serine hydrolase domain-containing protein [Paenibacillus aestuarii]
MDPLKRSRIVSFLEQEVNNQHIPGAVLYVSHQGQPLLKEAVGYRAVHPAALPMQLDTVFDLASLTKVIATLPAVLKLLEQGRLSLSDPIDAFLPDFTQQQGETVRILHLLTHTSGLAADLPMAVTLKSSREELLQRITQASPRHQPGTKVVYSDLGLIMLYLIIEHITGEPFEVFLQREFFDPLEMRDTSFLPKYEPERFAATEFSAEHNAYKSGIVHDEKAERLGGISGHAGLFSTVDDMACFAAMIEQGGVYKGQRILTEAAIELSRNNFTPYDAEFRGLGWQLKNPLIYSSSGDFMSQASYGHTGFTGTSLWFDPDIQLHVILLTNRVHYGRKDHILRLRPRLHNLIYTSL